MTLKNIKFKNMKKLILLLFVFLLSGFAYSQNPTYTVVLKNDIQTASNVYEFDIYIMRTGTTEFQLAAIQGGLTFNTLLKGAGTLSALYIAGTSDLTLAGQTPGNPNVASNGYWKLAGKLPSGGAGTGTIIPTDPGLRVGRFRLTNSVSFAVVNPNFAWNFSAVAPNYPTKVSAYIDVGGVPTNTDITATGTFQNQLGNAPLPVQLASFTGSVENKRDVTLSWKTTTETNNQGFEIERKKADGSWSKVGYLEGKGNSTSMVSYKFDDRKLNTGKYNYRLKQIDNNGNFQYHNLSTIIEVGVPTKYDLSQNYPNPFNPTTKIDYDLPFDSKVTMILYDMTGREVKTLVNNTMTAGYYTEVFNLSNLSSGTYFYRLIAKSSDKDYLATKKMMLIK